MKIDSFSKVSTFAYYQASEDIETKKPEEEKKSTLESSDKSFSSCFSTLTWPFRKVWQLISSLFSCIFCCCRKSELNEEEEIKNLTNLIQLITPDVRDSEEDIAEEHIEEIKAGIQKIGNIDGFKAHIALYFAEAGGADITKVNENKNKYEAEVDKVLNFTDKTYKSLKPIVSTRSLVEVLHASLVTYRAELILSLNKTKKTDYPKEELTALNEIVTKSVYASTYQSDAEFENAMKKINFDQLKVHIALNCAINESNDSIDIDELIKTYEGYINKYFNQGTKKLLPLSTMLQNDTSSEKEGKAADNRTDIFLASIVCYRIELLFSQ